MIIKAPDASFTLTPEGEYLARLAEVVDLGEEDSKFAPGETVHKMRLVWKLKNGSTPWQKVTASLHPQSKFYEAATGLLGEYPPPKLDPETLIGKTAYIRIQHNKSKQTGMVWANVTEVRPVTFRGRKLEISGAPEQDVPKEQAKKEKSEITDDDVPF